jgi:hypothetical protein
MAHPAQRSRFQTSFCSRVINRPPLDSCHHIENTLDITYQGFILGFLDPKARISPGMMPLNIPSIGLVKTQLMKDAMTKATVSLLMRK